jgi:hypothetical protein
MDQAGSDRGEYVPGMNKVGFPLPETEPNARPYEGRLEIAGGRTG